MWKAFKSLFVREKTNFQARDELQMKTDVAAAKLILPPTSATCTLFKKTSSQEENMECAKNPKELLDDEWIKFMSQRVSSKAEEQDINKSFHQDCSSFVNQAEETVETYKWNDMGYLSSKSQNRISEQDSACSEERKFEDAVEHLVKGFEDPTSNHIFPDLTDESSDEQTTPGAGNTCAEVPSLPALPSMPDLNEGPSPLQILNQDKMESIEDVKSNNTLKDEIENTKSSSTSPTLLKTTNPFKNDFNDEKNTLIVLNEGKMESIQDVESRTIHEGEIEKPESSSTLPMLLKATPTEVKNITGNVLVMIEGNSSERTENSLSDSKETIVHVPNSNKHSMINLVLLKDSNQAESDANSNFKTLNIPQENMINIKLQMSPVPETKVAKPKPRTKKKLLDLTGQPMLTVDCNNTTPKRKCSVSQNTPSCRNFRTPCMSQKTALNNNCRMPSTTQDTLASSDWRMPSISQGAISSSDWRYPLSSHVDGSYYSLLSQANGDHCGEVCHQDIYHNPAIFHSSQSAPMGNSDFVTVEYVDETYQTGNGMDLTKTPQKKPKITKYFYTVRPVSPFDGGALAKTMNKKIVLIKKKDQPSATQISGITNSTHPSGITNSTHPSGITNSTHPSGKLEKNLNQEKPNTQNSTVKVKEGVSNNTFNNLENTSATDVGKLMLEIFKKQMASSDATSNGKKVEQHPKCSASSLVCENALPGKLPKDNSTAMNLGKLMHDFIEKKMGKASKVKEANRNSVSSSTSSEKRKNTRSSSGEPCLKKPCYTKYPSKRETCKLVLTRRSLRKRKIESYKV